MDKYSLGKRIQLLRQKRGMIQEDVEEQLGFSQKSLTRIESGQRLPSTIEIAKLAEFFHMSIGDFLKSEALDEDPLVILHRVAPGLEVDPIVQEEVDRCVRLCKEGISLENLLGQPARQYVFFSSFERPSNASEAIRQGEQAAKEERRRLGLGGLPIRDIVGVLSSQGIWCAAVGLPSEMSGLFLYHPSIGKVVLINAAQAHSRQRFSYAHEYAHALFDSDQPALVSNAKNSVELIEKRANAFAAAFLMPSEGIAQILDSLNKGHGSRTSYSVFDVSTQGIIEAEERQLSKNQKISHLDVAFLANRFGVSYQAAVYRLHSLKYLSQAEREELLEKESSGREYLRLLGHEDSEQVDKSPVFQRELRTYISRQVVEAYRQGVISRGRVIELSRLLNLPPQALLEMTQQENE